MCENTLGSYQCICSKGFTFDDEQKKCYGKCNTLVHKKRCGENSTNNYNRPFYSCLLSDRLRKTARLEVTKLQLEFGGQFTLSNPLPSSTTVSLESYHLKRL